MSRVEVIGIKLPLIKPGDDIAEVVVEYAGKQGVRFLEGDVLVVTEKVVSKSMGLLVEGRSVKPSKTALKMSKKTNLDPRFVELVLRECDDVVAAVPVRELVYGGVIDLFSLAEDVDAAKRLIDEYPYLFIVLKEGMFWSDSGIDSSNAPPGTYIIPPKDHNRAARRIHERIRELVGRYVPVVICDTEFFLGGSMDFARGCWGLDPVDRRFGAADLYGRPKYGGVDLVAHELCAAAALVFKQSGEGVPAAIVRGLEYRRAEGGMDLVPRVDLEKAIISTLKASIRILGLRKYLEILLKILLKTVPS